MSTTTGGTDAGAGDAPVTAEPTPGPTTDWLVMAVAGEVAGGDEQRFGSGDWAPELWREVGVVTVPQRTTRTTVVERAKGLVTSLIDGDVPARVRVVQLSEVTDAEVAQEQPPPVLTATLLPRGAVEGDAPAP